MPKLPNVNTLVSQVHERVRQSEAVQQEKIAAESSPESFTVTAAQNLVKLAQALRAVSADTVTYDDVRRFYQNVGRYHG